MLLISPWGFLCDHQFTVHHTVVIADDCMLLYQIRLCILTEHMWYQLVRFNQASDANKVDKNWNANNIYWALTCLLLCVAEMSDYMDKVDRLKCLVLNMPPPNHDTLQFMCRHLKRWEGGRKTTPHSKHLCSCVCLRLCLFPICLSWKRSHFIMHNIPSGHFSTKEWTRCPCRKIKISSS